MYRVLYFITDIYTLLRFNFAWLSFKKLYILSASSVSKNHVQTFGINFLPTYHKLAQLILRCKFPPCISPIKYNPLQKSAPQKGASLWKIISPGTYFQNFTIFYVNQPLLSLDKNLKHLIPKILLCFKCFLSKMCGSNSSKFCSKH